MIILDTNVISEAMRGPAADPRVIAWLRSLPQSPVTTTINRSEILAGIALLPDGRRSGLLRQRADAVFLGLGVCLPLTDACASHYADIVANRSRMGRPIGGFDALIAAIARVSRAQLATRDISGFEGTGVELIDPWAIDPAGDPVLAEVGRDSGLLDGDGVGGDELPG
ncbi:type II toxin-antitoxin system VapC family toxin [Nostocoides jenkinsii]|uniref:Ribonuclease VapC n=1 Tax=Nostocoides jenkinsii Ben 74 TaxID=1193518 RepID=A0A077MAK5_9MICO|nr:type II toxin-antitoxin system VapC family toxin [Tetrasphaera jenkinsii]CCI54381.1 PilT protein domain protein [Tetrasphaera jenkinsii Ben 74]